MFTQQKMIEAKANRKGLPLPTGPRLSSSVRSFTFSPKVAENNLID
jgi:hypothetical protein